MNTKTVDQCIEQSLEQLYVSDNRLCRDVVAALDEHGFKVEAYVVEKASRRGEPHRTPGQVRVEATVVVRGRTATLFDLPAEMVTGLPVESGMLRYVANAIFDARRESGPAA